MQEILNAITEAKNARHFDLTARLATELKIAKFIIRHALKQGFVVSVNDGEEWVLKQSDDFSTILNAMFSTDEDGLMIRDPRKMDDRGHAIKVVHIVLIYGNEGWDVVSDWSAPSLEAVEWFMQPINDYASKFEPHCSNQVG